MPNSLLIRGGRIIDPAQNIDTVGSVLVEEGKIARVGADVTPPPDGDVLDAAGLIVCPGFIDLHCHLRQPGFEDRETMATGTLAAARGGFTTVCCMPNTEPPLDNESMIKYVLAIAAREAVVRVMPIGCVTRGRKGEELVDMNELEMAGAVAYSDDGAPVSSPELMRRALEYSRDFRRPVIDHCEDLSLSRGGQVNEGVVSLEMGLAGIPASAEENIVRRDLALARETGGHVHIAHVSTGGSVDLIRAAKEQGVPVTAEVTPHHLTLTEAAVLAQKTLAKVNPPLRTPRDARALLTGLNDGVIDIVATDHAPHTAAGKTGKFELAAFGISGLETALGSLVGLVFKSDLSLNTLVAALTVGPARVLGYEKLGTLEVGAPADITVFDLHREWVVDPTLFASKGKNTPLAGATLRGKVMATVYLGNPVYLDETMKITENIKGM
ncbi:MAG TPA: dihydroorotase [Dehalococcoidales bacterium]|nr:dihydroorotase [Dehalococcoidales bacterium]